MRVIFTFLSLLLCFQISVAQETEKKDSEADRGLNNPFRRMYQEFATPNQYRTASGAPGPAYYQQQADYVMQLELDDENQKLYGNETITYHNNSPEPLSYLWVQLDQNIREPNSLSEKKNNKYIEPAYSPEKFTDEFMKPPFEGGFHIESVNNEKGKALSYTINRTMMRIDLEKPLLSGEKFVFAIKWNYNINNYQKVGGRSGYEYFEDTDNCLYVIAQFFPRMAVYNDVEGWQNQQFWGSGEFALPFGNYDVSITVPSDHIVEATGELQNRKEVFTPTMLKRYELAEKTYDKPVIIVTQEEVEAKEKTKATDKKTWRYKAENVRDFGFSTSRKFIYDAMAVKIGDKNVMAISLYPKEGNPLWEDFSTKIVAYTLKNYSKHTFDYPYSKAVSVNAEDQGMEYPMICWNYGRPEANGWYSDRIKYGMMSVIIHEVGHNFFPMIVNSDERQWGWMDEGLNTFLQFLTEQSYGESYPQDIAPYTQYPSDRGFPRQIVPYMSQDPSYIAPIMLNPELVFQLGPNAYSKPATGLNILRETIMGEELFDFAFKTYANRWKFKHPTPEDFFRTMKDASAVDLDWFWRTWFYTTEYVDLGIKSVKTYQVSDKPGNELRKMFEERNLKPTDIRPLVYMTSKNDDAYDKTKHDESIIIISEPLNNHIAENYSLEEQAEMNQPNYFYEITFERIGGVPMPILLQLNYKDGSTETVKFPVWVWRKNNTEFTHVIATFYEVESFTIDPEEKTADINTANNHYPKQDTPSAFDEFRKIEK